MYGKTVKAGYQRVKYIMEHRWVMLWAAALGACGVAAGAFGAHALTLLLSPAELAVWDTAVRYQLLHAVVLLVLFTLIQVWQNSLLLRAAKLMAMGIVCFSGSLYLLALTGINWFGPITPLGGTLLIAGWMTLFYAAIRSNRV